MAKPAAGDYRIISAKGSASSPFAFDVSGGTLKDGANVDIRTPALSPMQYFTVSFRADGSARILSRIAGKSVDVAKNSLKSGSNVLIWKATDARNQLWDIESDGQTATFQGTSYPTYTIKCSAAKNLAIDIKGGTMADGTNVVVWTANGGDNQRWIFVPVPAFTSGGIYELRSMLKTSMCADVTGDSRGSNVMLYERSGENGQKFIVTEESSGQWSLQNVSSGMFVDVAGGAASAGTNVQQWDDTDQRAQRWKVINYGTTTVDGTTCAVVSLGSYVTNDGQTYFADVYNAMTSNNANVDIQTASSSAKQRWALVPTTPLDGGVPVVANLGWTATAGAAASSDTLPEAEELYPTWVTTMSWSTDGPNHYEWRWRTQLMSDRAGTWGSWSEWTAWAVAPAAQQGTRAWVPDGLPAEVPDGSRAMRYALQVRAMGVLANGLMVTGPTASATLTSVRKATVTLGSMGFGPEGLRIAYESDYAGGTNVVSIDSVKVGGTEYVASATRFPALDASGSMLVPMSSLRDWIADGATATVRFRNGTDMLPLSTATTVTGTVSYDAGSGMSATPTITVGEGRTLQLTVPTADVTAAWMRYEGQLTEMRLTDGVAYLTPPFGSSITYEFFVSVASSGGDNWGVAHVTSQQSRALMSAYKPCHAWNWDGGHFLLEVREGEPLETDYGVRRNHETYQLNSREWESVHYQKTKSGSFTATGALVKGLTESARADLEAMCDQGYVTYRSPSGLVADVAVTEFSITEHAHYTEVSVSMTRVTN